MARVVVDELGDSAVREGDTPARGDFLDHDETTETVDFSYRGIDYQIDLSLRQALAMHQAFVPYMKAARRVPTAGRVSTRQPASLRKVDTGESATPVARDVRAWALAHGIPVSGRGRVPAEVMSRYQEAHAG